MSGRRITIVEDSPAVPVTASAAVSDAVTVAEKRLTQASIGAHAERIKAFPEPLLTGAHPVNGCICIWVWCPDIGGKVTPFVRKFVNVACHAHNGDG